ncbi:MAG: 5-formyltetrahydrofolate cyclo-ligase, partial [Oscillospiraceae bacterium]
SVMAAATVCLVLNLGLDTLWLQIFMNKGILALLPTRAVKCIVMLPLEAAGLWMLRKNRDTWFKSQTDAIAAEYRARARGILKGNPKMREVQSERICSAVTSLEEFKNAKTVFCFVGTDREIDTSLIIKKCFEEKKTLCVPRCEKGNELTARRINLLSELKLGKFGLLEPDEHSQIVDKSDIDFSVIPASAVDLSLHRMGKGGGFYDRYLSDSGDMYKVAVCPSQLCVAALLATENDVPMDAVVTENKIRRKMKNKSKTARIHEQT